MKNTLAKLESNEVILMMYLANELPAHDRDQIEHLLKNDPGMRATLESLQLAWSRVDQAFAQADRQEPVHVASTVANTIAAMRQWHADAASRPLTRSPVAPGLPLPWWCYPLASAAAIILAFAVWIANREPDRLPYGNPAVTMTEPAGWADPAPPDSTPPAIIAGVADASVVADVLTATLDDSDQIIAESLSPNSLAQAGRELATIEQLSQDMVNQ